MVTSQSASPKTQYSFSTDPNVEGRAGKPCSGHSRSAAELREQSFIVVVCGDSYDYARSTASSSR